MSETVREELSWCLFGALKERHCSSVESITRQRAPEYSSTFMKTKKINLKSKLEKISAHFRPHSTARAYSVSRAEFSYQTRSFLNSGAYIFMFVEKVRK